MEPVIQAVRCGAVAAFIAAAAYRKQCLASGINALYT